MDLKTEPGGLSPSEQYWKGHFEWLRDQGYQLRDRLSPTWVPSWKGTEKSWVSALDGQILPHGSIVDAVRISDGRQVALKYLDQEVHPDELEITRYLCSEELATDPKNHCIRLLDVLYPPSSQGSQTKICFLVLPHLRKFDSPPFDTYGEAIGFMTQIFEGLLFMHEHHIAHRDFDDVNVMMDPANICPAGYHPVLPTKDRTGKKKAMFKSRTQCSPRYIIIDMGLSHRFSGDDPDPRAPTILGGDKTVPEFQNGNTEPQNVLRTDVYYAGNLLREKFITHNPQIPISVSTYRGFEFMSPLIDDMTHIDPLKRPTMSEVVERFDSIVRGLSPWKLRSRLIPTRRKFFNEPALILSHWTRRVGYIIRRTPPIPCALPCNRQ